MNGTKKSDGYLYRQSKIYQARRKCHIPEIELVYCNLISLYPQLDLIKGYKVGILEH